MNKFLLLLAVSLSSLAVSAADYKIFSVTNNADNGYYDISIVTNDTGTVKGLKLYDRTLKESEFFRVENLKKGITLNERSGHKVVVLRSSEFDNERGGYLTVDYLKSGISGSRASFEVKAEGALDKWDCFKDGKKVNLMNFKVRKIFGKIIGIKEVKIQ